MQMKCAKSTSATSMDNSLWDSFMVKSMDLQRLVT